MKERGMKETHLTPADSVADQMEELKLRIGASFERSGQGKGITIVFTSCEEGEGVSSIAANFAASIATEDDKSVLLMDCNLRNPSLHKLFRGNGARKETRRGNSKRSASTTRPGAKRAPTAISMSSSLRNRAARAAPSTGKTGLPTFWRNAQERYDYIILDCPPVRSDVSAALLGAQAHGVAFVIQAERVRREVIQRSIALLEDSGVRILGAVLNRRRYPIPAAIYRFL